MADCGAKFYKDTSSLPLTCRSCDFRCTACTGPSNTECSSCDLSKASVIQGTSSSCFCADGYAPNFEKEICESKFQV